MVNYQNGKIYKITGINSIGRELIYIGSTTVALSQRLAEHNLPKNKKKIGLSANIIMNYCENINITLIENISCNSKDELLKKEREYYDKYNCINYLKPYRTNEEMKEYSKIYYKNDYINNFEKYAKNSKKYYDENKQRLLNIQKQKYTCECGSTLNTGSKSEHIKTKKHLAFTCNGINISNTTSDVSSFGNKTES